MDKQSIIGQLELDINALQRQVEDFKNHPEGITEVEWQLFVQRLHLMHEYAHQLKMQAEAVMQKVEQIITPVLKEHTPPPVKVPVIIAEEVPLAEKIAPPPVERMEITEIPLSRQGEPAHVETGHERDQQAEVIAHIYIPATEAKTASSKQKKQTANVGGLFGDMHSLADNFKDEPSVADTIARTKSEKSVAHTMAHKPIKDLKDAIGINEKFLFINELFDGNLQDYSEALSKLNGAENLQSAEEFIRAELSIRFNWTDDNSHVKNFRELVERRFIS